MVQNERLSTRDWLGAVVAGGLLMQATVSWTSHSAAVTDGVVGIVADFAHLLGAALWIGGLVVLAMVVPTLLHRVSDDVAQPAAQLIRRFTVLATAGVTISVATGLTIAAWHVPTVNSLSATRYGSALSVKVALVLVAIGLGGFNRFILHRRLRTPKHRHEDRSIVRAMFVPLPTPGFHSTSSACEVVQTFVRAVRIELVILVVVVLLSGVITSIPTAANAIDQDESTNEIVYESVTNNVTATLRVVPGQVGPNVFDIQLTQDGERVSADEPVTILLQQSEQDTSLPQMELNRTGHGMYSTVGMIPRNGTWELRVNTWINGTYVSDHHTINVSSTNSSTDQMDHTQHQQQPTGSDFTRFLRFGALGVAIAGTVAVGYETMGTIARRRDD
ncbi:copper resistance D family protein [Halocatena marina]|uniref:Copper resistance D family protein n=1 Tax=Halocatena marina TaxID=2934937 RepID=A0ABD5YVK1_9EURY